MKSFRIENLKLRNSLILAPMVDVTDLPYRLICRKAGAALAFTEMVYVDSLLHENPKTLRTVKTCEEDRPLGLQITGSKFEHFEEFVRREDLWKDYDLIDLNCGCPSLKIAGKSGAGSFLMKKPDKIGEFVRILKKTGKTVSVKVRLGFDEINVLKVARIAEKAGANAITVHARLAMEGGRDRARWEWIKAVKDSVGIPVIGNGDVYSWEDAEGMVRETGCDGVMIGRAAIGNPLIFSRALKYFKGGKEEEGCVEGNLRMFLEYIKLGRKYYGDGVDLGKIKYVGGSFLRRVRGAASMRGEFYKLGRLRDIEDFISMMLDSGKFS